MDIDGMTADEVWTDSPPPTEPLPATDKEPSRAKSLLTEALLPPAKESLTDILCPILVLPKALSDATNVELVVEIEPSVQRGP